MAMAIPGQLVPAVGRILCMAISLLSTTVLTLFLTQRSLAIKIWSRLPIIVWLVFAIYIDSYLFVFTSAVLQQSVGVNTSLATCEGAILLCLVCYVTTKIVSTAFIYLFLVEKAHFVRGTTKKRLHSKLYLFNCFGMLGLFVVVGILNFVFRIAKLEDGKCIIGMKSVAMIPLISFDTLVNIYLTILFLVPLRNLYSYKNMPRTPGTMRLRNAAFRTLFGAVSTLISSIVNLSVLMSLNGEEGWVCLLCCNCDILFSAIVIQWVTSKDNAGTEGSNSSRSGHKAAHCQSATQELVPCGMRSVCETSRDDSLHPSVGSSAKSDFTADEAIAGCGGGIRVTTTIKREIKADNDATRFGAPRQGECRLKADIFAAEEGRVNFDSVAANGFDSTDGDTGSSGSRTTITAVTSSLRQPPSPKRG